MCVLDYIYHHPNPTPQTTVPTCGGYGKMVIFFGVKTGRSGVFETSTGGLGGHFAQKLSLQAHPDAGTETYLVWNSLEGPATPSLSGIPCHFSEVFHGQ